mmetsp:Transcript_84473/g.237480  ORF Transcript_84473/g.237480 Transcript_84473/m.237480 type:complete len:330 (-) Transcript_84473:1970-2959(-)
MVQPNHCRGGLAQTILARMEHGHIWQQARGCPAGAVCGCRSGCSLPADAAGVALRPRLRWPPAGGAAPGAAGVGARAGLRVARLGRLASLACCCLHPRPAQDVGGEVAAGPAWPNIAAAILRGGQRHLHRHRWRRRRRPTGRGVQRARNSCCPIACLGVQSPKQLRAVARFRRHAEKCLGVAADARRGVAAAVLFVLVGRATLVLGLGAAVAAAHVRRHGGAERRLPRRWRRAAALDGLGDAECGVFSVAGAAAPGPLALDRLPRPRCGALRPCEVAQHWRDERPSFGRRRGRQQRRRRLPRWRCGGLPRTPAASFGQSKTPAALSAAT